MRRILVYICCICLCLSLTACESTADIYADGTHSRDFKDYESMAELLGEYGIRFGTSLNPDTAVSSRMQELIAQHFNSVTANNEMKAYSLLDQQASMNAADGMPVMDFSLADVIMEAAISNGAKVRGHVLVWDAYMTDWFFRDGYQTGGGFVDRDTMLKRLESYITQVITYFEEKYPGEVYCWDVVNEAIGDAEGDYNPADERHIRVYREGGENLFYQYIGDDYVELAFLYAGNAVEALQAKNPEVDIKLFYNDYNAFYPEKREAICRLVDSINNYATDEDGQTRKLCDGVGMQGYIGGYGTQQGCLDPELIPMIKEAVLRYADLGVEVQITEMAVRNYSSDKQEIRKHEKFYTELISTLVDLNSGEEKPLTCIAIWGLTDLVDLPREHYTYKLNSPYCGLFTSDYQVKKVFSDVYEMLKSKKVK